LSLLTIALYFCFKVLDKKNLRNLLIFSLFGAILTCSRMLGIFLIISFIIFYLFALLSNKNNWKNLLFLIIFLISYCFFTILFWPYLWSDPINNFILGFKYFSNFPLQLKMIFNGEYVSSHFLPKNYIFIWIFITTPILYTVLFFLGYAQIFKRFFIRFINVEKNKDKQDFWKGVDEKKDLFIFFNLTVIILYLISFNIPLYSGWRHVYFLNVFIIYISIVGFYQIDIYMKRKSR